jgi:DNA-binding beta-propeller fold protein YncE
VESEIHGPILGDALDEPTGLAVDFNGFLYVIDAGENRLIKFDSQLRPIDETGGYGTQLGLFSNPSFVTLDRDLNLLVSDESNRRIVRFNSRLEFVDEISFQDPGDALKLGYPSGLAVTDYGELWVSGASIDSSVISVTPEDSCEVREKSFYSRTIRFSCAMPETGG